MESRFVGCGCESHVRSYILLVVVYFQPAIDRAHNKDFLDAELASRLLEHGLMLVELVEGCL